MVLEKEKSVGCVLVEVVLKLPEPMNREEARGWESCNREPRFLWLEEFEPVGPLPAAEWKAVYEECDDVTAGLCS